jgi:hypothetical protein
MDMRQETWSWSVESRSLVDEGELIQRGIEPPEREGLFEESGKPLDLSSIKTSSPVRAVFIRRVRGGFVVERRVYTKTLRFKLKTWEAEVRQDLAADSGMVAVKTGPNSWRISAPRKVAKVPVRLHAEAYGDALLVSCGGDTRFWFRRGGRLEWIPSGICDMCGKPMVFKPELAKAVGVSDVTVGRGHLCISCALEREKKWGRVKEEEEDKDEV